MCKMKSSCLLPVNRTICVILFLVLNAAALPRVIHLGGLFDTEDREQELAFRIAVDFFNSDKKIQSKPRIIAQVERISRGDVYDATKKVCRLLQKGVAAIFGPQDHLTSLHVRSICDEVEVPHIEMRWDYKYSRDDLSINLYPSSEVLSESYVAMIKTLGWQNFTLIYEDKEGIIRLHKLLKEAQINNWHVQMYNFEPGLTYREVLWKVKKDLQKLREKLVWDVSDIRKLKTEHDENYKIVLDVHTRNLYSILKQAQQIGMMSEHQEYFITSLDLHTIDLEDFKYSRANISSLRLIKDWNNDYYRLIDAMQGPPYNYDTGQELQLRTETALMYDAVQMFIFALQGLDEGKYVQKFPSISCNNPIAEGSDGTSLINYMKSISLASKFKKEEEDKKKEDKKNKQGLTGDVVFNGQGIRSTFNLDIMHLSEEGLLEVGRMYLPDKAVNMTRKIPTFSPLEEKTLIVTTILEVDMAVAGLSINSKREEAVDFTLPFMNTGISILYKKPTTKVSSLFSFLSPFSAEVWIYLIGAYFAVGTVTYFIGRLTPYEWINPYPCRQDDIVVENVFNVRNSLWVILGTVMQQGSEIVTTACSTRTLYSFWSFFTLILVSSYTANLAAFLTVERVVYPFHNAQELAKQKKIKYGCLKNGTTEQFFKESKIDIYKEMWRAISSDPKNLVDKNPEGKAKVYKEDYAYLMESAAIEYVTERVCNITQIGGLLDSKGYGIAIKKGNKDLGAWLSMGILKLQERGTLHILKERWWKQRGGGKCAPSSKQSSGSARKLSLDNVGGVFVVLIFGLAVAVLLAVMEFSWKSAQWENPNKESFWTRIKKEIKFTMSFDVTAKPVPQLKKNKSVTPTVENSRASSHSRGTNKSVS
ncbi:glutamate receptor ionotropic, kainate 2-like isoform X2 [Stegodyphus dumicola]|uniref:glutamate receptor ionotropic, kainate 2-like isoform X2 n=1 Tax=Stegodyphus dumicola TaxID=202533 RepID=UPI0015B0CA3B|nr:glutamate receptor ionotropic, kainate 2-like isoform X2 [Stegodyphus dumicola]